MWHDGNLEKLDSSGRWNMNMGCALLMNDPSVSLSRCGVVTVSWRGKKELQRMQERGNAINLEYGSILIIGELQL